MEAHSETVTEFGRTTWLAVLFDKTRRGALRKHGRDAECQSSKLEWRTGKPFHICRDPVRSDLLLRC
jgi:hypothetical protein